MDSGKPLMCQRLIHNNCFEKLRNFSARHSQGGQVQYYMSSLSSATLVCHEQSFVSKSFVNCLAVSRGRL